ncbi:MAG: RNA polymerase sigma factor [Acidimicrobiales bacterium]
MTVAVLVDLLGGIGLFPLGPRVPLGGERIAMATLPGPQPAVPLPAEGSVITWSTDATVLVTTLFAEQGDSLVRLVRLFVDDRNAAEDLVQEAFIRLARAAHRINDPTKAAAYLRSIALNLARDHNRRGLVSLRHRLPIDDEVASTEDVVVLREDQQIVVDALRALPHRQRDCLILRYFDELGIDAIASALGISRNSVKTHLTRGARGLERALSGSDIQATHADGSMP